MLGLRAILATEGLWPAGVAAFMIHSLVISALAWNRAHSQGSMQRALKNNFCVEAVFEQGTGGDTLPQAIAYDNYSAEQRDRAFQKPRPLDPTNRVAYEEPFKKPAQKKSQEAHQTSLFASTPPLTSSSSEAGHSLPLYNPPPVYPREARRQKIQGVVLVQVFLTATGEVEKIVTLPPRIDPLLEEAALKAIYKWKFKPGVRTVEVPVEFKLMV